MSKQIITDYMAGKIGDKYYETVGEGCKYVGRIDDIDSNDDDLRYHLEPTKKDLRWRYKDAFDHFEREVTGAEPDDDGMDKITDITQVQPGDIEVAKSGNRYKVVRNESASDTFKLKVTAPELGDSEMWLSDFEFAYALRPKPEVPTDPGLYRDCNGNIWVLDAAGIVQQIVCDGEYVVGFSLLCGLIRDYAPYTRIDLERES